MDSLENDSSEWQKISDESLAEVSEQDPVTPESERIPVALGFGSGGSSDVTPNHDDSDSSYSELDSEAEAFYSSFNHHLVSSDEKQMSYGELMKRFVQCEEELRMKSVKLQESELEIEKLKGEAEKREYAVLLAEDLRVELEAVRKETEMRNIGIEAEKTRVHDLESHLSDSDIVIDQLKNKLEETSECLDVSDAQNSKLREMLRECQKSFSEEKTKMETYIAGLLEKQTFFKARVVEVESHSEIVESHNYEMKMKETKLQNEINKRNVHIEELNKSFDDHKVRYDMLKAEKDGVDAEIENLKAEMRSRMESVKLRDSELEAVKREYDVLLALGASEIEAEKTYVEKLKNELEELKKSFSMEKIDLETVISGLVSESGTAKNTVEELKGKVKELENVISEGEEKKREVIRQLSFSFDHYKTGYKQLLRALSSQNKQQATNSQDHRMS